MQNQLSKFKKALPIQLIHKAQKDEELIHFIEEKIRRIIPEEVFLKPSNHEIIRVGHLLLYPLISKEFFTNKSRNL